MVVGDVGRSSAREGSGESRAICICDGVQGQIGHAPCKFQAVAGDTGEDGRGKEGMGRNQGTDRSAMSLGIFVDIIATIESETYSIFQMEIILRERPTATAPISTIFEIGK